MNDPEDTHVTADGRTVNVLDLIDPREPRASHDVRVARLTVCRECPRKVGPGTRCSVCGCWMPAKTWLLNATCPEGRWSE